MMNFTIKYHKPAQACMCLQGKELKTYSNSSIWTRGSIADSTCSFKDTSGNPHNTLVNSLNTGYNNVVSASYVKANKAIYHNLTAYASNEAIADFDDDAYTVSSIGTATQSFSVGYTNCTYTVSVSNVSGQSDITVNSIKFTKSLYATAESDAVSTCLMYSCYLDTPVVIPADEEKVFVVVFNFLNP